MLEKLFHFQKHKEKPWYADCLEKCQECFSRFPDQLVEGGNPFLKCRCGNRGKSGKNIGVAIAEWNKIQRKLRATRLQAEAETPTELIQKVSGF